MKAIDGRRGADARYSALNGGEADQQLTDSLLSIVQATPRLFVLEEVLDDLCRDIQRTLGFDFAAVQLVRPEEQVIETVLGTDIAERWTGLAKHYLERDRKLRDIQADLCFTGYTEILSGWDPRFDKWIYEANGHANLTRVYTPIFVIRDVHGDSIEDWWRHVDWTPIKRVVTRQRRHVVLKPDFAALGGPDLQPAIQVIGTVEAGYKSGKREINVERALQMASIVAKHTPRIYESLLPYLLDQIVDRAKQLGGAAAAQLKYFYDSTRRNYVYEAFTGEFRPDHAKLNLDFRLGAKDDVVKRAGLLALYFDRRDSISPSVEAALNVFASHLGDVLRVGVSYLAMHDRTRQLRALHSVARSLAASPAGPELLRLIAWDTLNLLGADVVTIYEYDEALQTFTTPPDLAGRLRFRGEMGTEIGPRDAPTRLLAGGENVFAVKSRTNPVLNDPTRPGHESSRTPFVVRERIRSSAGILLTIGEEKVGAMFINYRRQHRFDIDEQRLIETLAATAAVAIKNRRTLLGLEKAVRDKARLDLAAELHDAVHSSVRGAILVADAATDAIESGRLELGLSHLHQVRRVAWLVLSDTGMIMDDYWAGDGGDPDIGARIRNDLARSYPATAPKLTIDTDATLPVLAVHDARQILLVVREAVMNALRHAAAGSINVSVTAANSVLHVAIVDDGRGIPSGRVREHHGLTFIQQRVAELCGEVSVESNPGTTIRVKIPYAEAVP